MNRLFFVRALPRPFLASVVGSAAALAAPAAFAHGFGQRFDLPLPLWLWLTGAGATLVLTFVVMALFVRERSISSGYPRFDLMRFALVRWAAHPVAVAFVRLLAVLLYLLTLAAGFFGDQSPYANLITTMVWVVWWVGVAFFSALIGDLWALINPLNTLFAWAEAACGRRLSLRLPYPRWLGAWPAVLVFLSFAWAELIWGSKDVPIQLATVLAVYSVFTWLGMVLFGREVWLARGEAFSVAFGLLARFAPVEYIAPAQPGARGQLNLRPYGAGLMTTRPVHGSFMVFVILMLASVTYDGFQETALMQRVDTAVQGVHAIASLLFDLSDLGFDESRVVHSVMLVLFAAAFVAIFWLASWIMLRWTRAWLGAQAGAEKVTASMAACSFVLTMVPIAVAYHLSHYFSLLLTAGQFVIPLASDPFGAGWNLFGTAGYKVNLAIVSPYVFWYSAVVIIVVGHVIAVYLAHMAALRLFRSHRGALVSQVPMLLLMVGYTTLSLWILAQPIVG